MKKQIFSIIMVLVLFISLVPVTHAKETVYTSTVLKDLSSMKFDGEFWDIRDYPKNENDPNVYLIAVDEKGFRKDGNLDDYELNVYVYNPSGQAIENSPNKVQMAVAWNEDGSVSEYEKFTLMLKSFSTEEGYENVFIKYRVFDHKSTIDGKTMKERLLENKSRRVYNISSFELRMKTDGKIKDFAYGCDVVVQGYDVGCGEGNTISTKQITYTPFETLELDVRQAYWRTQSSNKGVNYKHQINSAYFSVPNEVWEKYEQLYSIKCVWEEHHTTPMVVTDDTELYNSLKSIVGKTLDIDANSFNFPYFEGCPELYSGLEYESVGSSWNANYAINPNTLPTGMHREDPRYENFVSPLCWLFLTDEAIELNKICVSAEEVKEYYEKNASLYENVQAPSYGIGGFLLKDTVDSGREQYRNGMTVYFDDDSAFDLSNYDSSHGWLQKIIDYNIFNGGFTLKGFTVDTSESYNHFRPIESFRAGDEKTNNILGYLSEADYEKIMTDHFLGSEKQVDDFRLYLADAILHDETVVLFRYASTDYFSEELTAFPAIEGRAFVSTQTAFLGFDVIQLQFKDEETNIVTLAVTSDPEDVFTGVDSSTVSNKNDNLDNWWEQIKRLVKLALMVISVVAIVLLVMRVIGLISDFSFKRKVRKNLRSRRGSRGKRK